MSEDRTVESHDLPPFTARQQSTQGSHSGYRDNDHMTSYRTRQADFTVKAAAEEGHVIRPLSDFFSLFQSVCVQRPLQPGEGAVSVCT